MKIGAGGLQSLVMYDALRQPRFPENVRLNEEPPGDAGLSANAPSREEIIHAVDKLNRSAELYNQPFEFKLKEEDGKMSVEIREKQPGGQSWEIPPEKAVEMAAGQSLEAGALLDGEV